MIKFYVLVPVYKAEKLIRKCVGSVINQTYNQFELILVDDGSPDNSGQICDELAKENKNIHVIHQTNMGQLAARRTAEKYVLDHFELSNAYVVYLDSDDTLQFDAFELLLAVIDKHSPDMIIYELRRVFEHEHSSTDELNGDIIEIDNKKAFYKAVLTDESYNSLCRKAVKAELLCCDNNYSQYCDVRYGEDLIRSLSYYKDSQRIVYYKKALYNYYINQDSVTHTITADNYDVDCKARKAVREFIKSEKIFNEDDYKEYLFYIQRLLFHKIKHICYMEIATEKKFELLNLMRVNDVWNECIEYKVDSIILKLFKRGNMGTIITLYSLRKILSRFKRGFIALKKR